MRDARRFLGDIGTAARVAMTPGPDIRRLLPKDFLTFGHARRGFVAGVTGLPLSEPSDPFDRAEWDRGSEIAGVVTAAEMLAGGPWGSGRPPGRFAMAGTGPRPHTTPAARPVPHPHPIPAHLAKAEGDPGWLPDRVLTPGERDGVRSRISDAGTKGVAVSWTKREVAMLRAEAREVYKLLTGKDLPRGSQVHHVIPLEFADLFPSVYPNDPSNLVLMKAEVHQQLHANDRFFLKYAPRTKSTVSRVVEASSWAFKTDMKRLPKNATLPGK